VVLVFAIDAKAEYQKRKKGFKGKGLGEEKGKNGRILGKPYPHERKEEREERRNIQTISKEMQ